MRCLPAVPRHRFTPAHAGNTNLYICYYIAEQVHPRSRGEYRTRLRAFPLSSGSPPLTRGIRTSSHWQSLKARFTPAHAGNTMFPGKHSNGEKVHPRSRGEYVGSLLKSLLANGSPPLTRGILRKTIDEQEDARFTPAHAGNTLSAI